MTNKRQKDNIKIDEIIMNFAKDKKVFPSEILEEIQKTYPNTTSTIVCGRLRRMIELNKIESFSFYSDYTRQYKMVEQKL